MDMSGQFASMIRFPVRILKFESPNWRQFLQQKLKIVNSGCLLDIDKTGVLVKESSHLLPDKLILITGESNRIELFSNKVPRSVDAKFEQRILKSSDSSNECFHCHGLVLKKDAYRMHGKKCLIMFIHGGPHRFGSSIQITNLTWRPQVEATNFKTNKAI